MESGALSGTMIDGRYRVGPIIGTGGFGVVYEATHLGLAGKVALKVPRVADVSATELSELVAGFFEEGRTLKRLRHPSIVAALDVGMLPPDGAGRSLPYLVLEWCEGLTLREWLSNHDTPLSQAQAWALLRPAFEGMGHAHDQGIAHRDLKPGNIILEEQRDALVARVIDFGIAKLVSTPRPDASGATVTTSESRTYTPKYAAPEQLVGLRSGPASDVYSLALVLLEVITGRPVFATDDVARLAVAEGHLPTPRKLGLDLGAWSHVLEKALAMRASDRYPDANAFLRALDCVPPSSTREPVGLEVRRSTPPVGLPASRISAAPRDSSAPSRTVGTGVSRNMAYSLEQLGARKIFVALHTAHAPSDEEWRGWTALVEHVAKAHEWDAAKTANLVITDGGAPNTAQRTVINTLIAQAKTLPAVAVVTSSVIVRTMIRGFSIFNPNVAAFAPAHLAKAVEHVGLTRAEIPRLIAACTKLETEVLHAGAVETLAAITRMRL